MHKGSEQVFCPSDLSPRVPELKGSRMDATALCYFRKRPCHHRDYTLPPIQAPGEGVSVGPRVARKELVGRARASISLASGQGPRLRYGHIAGPGGGGPEPERVEVPGGPHNPSHPRPRSNLAASKSRRPRAELRVLTLQRPRSPPTSHP